MKTILMANGPKFVPFNFTHRFMLTALQAKIPRAFIDLGARARAEFDVSYTNSRVNMSGFCSTVDDIIKTIGPDFDNIWSQGQIDPLPLPAVGTQPCRSCGTRATMLYASSFITIIASMSMRSIR